MKKGITRKRKSLVTLEPSFFLPCHQAKGSLRPDAMGHHHNQVMWS